MLGAPVALRSPPFAPVLVVACVLLALAFPMLGVSAICLLFLERLVLRRLPGMRHWLALQPV